MRMPSVAPSPKPTAARDTDVFRSFNNTPSLNSLTEAAATSKGPGKRFRLVKPNMCANCQTAITKTMETKGRKGKGVTVITGLPLVQDELASLAKRLKQRCGSGGTVRDGVIEIQGDHRDRLVAELSGLGYRAKKAGG